MSLVPLLLMSLVPLLLMSLVRLPLSLLLLIVHPDENAASLVHLLLVVVVHLELGVQDLVLIF